MEKIAARLELPASRVQKAVRSLTEMGFLERAPDKRIKVTKFKSHIARDSILAHVHQLTWRLRALEHLRDERGGGRDINYTGLYTLSRSDAEKLRKLIHDFLDETRALVEPSLEETAVCLNVDCFEL